MVRREYPTPSMTVYPANYLIISRFYCFHHSSPDTNIHLFLCQHYIPFSTLCRYISAWKKSHGIDFRLVKKWPKKILDKMDHQHVNDLPFFAGKNPSSENIAFYVYAEMQAKTKTSGVSVLRVKVWESESAAVTYG